LDWLYLQPNLALLQNQDEDSFGIHAIRTVLWPLGPQPVPQDRAAAAALGDSPSHSAQEVRPGDTVTQEAPMLPVDAG
jgi:hypothetical protein